MFDIALKLFCFVKLLFHQEFGVPFQEDTKNVVLLKNSRHLSFDIQKTAHTNFAKITSIK